MGNDYCTCVLTGITGMAVGGWAGYAIEKGITTRSGPGIGMVLGMLVGGLAGAVGYRTVAGEKQLPVTSA